MKHAKIRENANRYMMKSPDEEEVHFENVCSAYRSYSKFAMSRWTEHQHRLQALANPQRRRKLLPDGLITTTDEYTKRFQNYKEAVICNQFCLDCILRFSGQPHSQQKKQGAFSSNSDEDMSKVSSCLKSLARDWSAEGKIERDMAYDPIKALIMKYLPIRSHTQNDCDEKSLSATTIPKIQVPGGGVGRLAFDLAAMGYNVQGNDFSLYMLLASDFILNNDICSPDRPLGICPWLLESRNIHKNEDKLRKLYVPDIDPKIIMRSRDGDQDNCISSESFSMAAGDFISIYSNPNEVGRWDCVASCFFLDACPNIVETFGVIYNMLKPGGLFVNLGPLMYHWSGPAMRPGESITEFRNRYDHLDDRYFTSIDLSYEDVKEILMNVGFHILEESLGLKCYYTADRKSMMNTEFRCVSFAAQKSW